MNPLNTWKGKLEATSFFLPSKYLDRQCVVASFLMLSNRQSILFTPQKLEKMIDVELNDTDLLDLCLDSGSLQ